MGTGERAGGGEKCVWCGRGGLSVRLTLTQCTPCSPPRHARFFSNKYSGPSGPSGSSGFSICSTHLLTHVQYPPDGPTVTPVYHFQHVHCTGVSICYSIHTVPPVHPDVTPVFFSVQALSVMYVCGWSPPPSVHRLFSLHQLKLALLHAAAVPVLCAVS